MSSAKPGTSAVMMVDLTPGLTLGVGNRIAVDSGDPRNPGFALLNELIAE